MHYYKFHIPDWNLATGHLSLEEEAIYFRLINFYYDTEAPIPKETQTVIRRLRLGSHSVSVGLILEEFFVLEDDGWHHKRCDEVISEYHGKAELNRENGKKGGRPPRNGAASRAKNPDGSQMEPRRNPDVTLTTNHKPITNNQESNTSDRRSPPVDKSVKNSYPADFEMAWTSYPFRPNANKRAAFKSWSARVKAGADPLAIMQGAARYKLYCDATISDPQYIKQPSTFFGPDEHYLSDWSITQKKAFGGNNERREFVDNSAPARAKRAMEEARRQRGEAEPGDAIEGHFERIPF